MINSFSLQFVIFLFFKIIFILMFLELLYLSIIYHLLSQEVQKIPRDIFSGIIINTEARTLMPIPEKNNNIAVLMIHGFASSRQDFSNLGHLLCNAGYTVREMRLPGHGSTPMEFAHQKEDALYTVAQAEFKQLSKKFDKIILIGFSTGGALCSILAAENQVHALVLLAPLYKIRYKAYHLFPAEWICYGTAWAIPYFPHPHHFIKINKKENINNFFCYQILPNNGVKQIIKLSCQANQPQKLKKITAPILWCHSPNDNVTSVLAAQKAVKMMSSSIKESYSAKNSDHILLHDHDAEEIKQRVLSFFKNLK